VARLAFGPKLRPSAFGSIAPFQRVIAFTLLTWALAILYLLPAKAHRSTMKLVEKGDRQHIALVLDVSPSMKLRDAGLDQGLSRTQRASAVVQSLLKRVSDERLHITIIATYNGAKPVVEESRDREVLLNVLDGLPMDQVFPTGKTKLFDGLEEAAKIAKDWPIDSTTLLIVSDGDTVPATGMPRLPKSIGGTLVIGVGDPVKGSFINGRQSRQDVAALRQIANRLGGEYHDGNVKHIPTVMLRRLGTLDMEAGELKFTLREYAILTAAISAFFLAFLPLLLHLFGSTWAPGPPKFPNNSTPQES
jgi:Ca-activated chloride channel family protein